MLSTAWDVVRSYSQYSTALYHGAWYLSLQNSNTGNLPDASGSAWWAVAPSSLAAWDSSRNYGIDEFVSYSGAWYRCFKEPTANQVPTNATYWVSMTGSTYPWSSATAYTTSSYVNYGGVWYLCALAHTNQTPNNSTYWTALGAPVIYAQGTATLPDSTAPIVTQLRATIAPAPLFPNAIAAANGVTVGAGAGTVDSYDASKAAYSSPGGFGATIASSYTTNPAVNITGTTAVQGYLAAPSASTTPYAPLYSSGGTVKGAASGSTSIDLTRISRSPFIPNYAIQTAIQHTAVPGTLPTTLNIGTPGAPTPSIYYDTSSWTLVTVVNINGPVILYVSASIRVTTGNININSTGSLVVYLTGRFRVESGSGGIINRSPSSANPDPKNLVILGDSAASTTQYYNYTTNPFYGVIYLPNTTTATGLTIASGVTNYGALSAKKITFSGAASLHYDTSLRSASFTGVDQPYAIIQWRELTDQTERAILP